MRKLLLGGVLALFSLLWASPARANENAQGWCEVGAQPVVTSGLNSSTQVQVSLPQCTVTVFVHGGGLATIFSDNNATPTPLANPFTATTDGQWLFYAGDGRYDVQLSGTGFPFPVTYSDILLCDPANHGACGGGGGGGGVGPGTPNIIAEFITPTTIGNSSIFDDRINVPQSPNGFSIMARPLTELWPNASGGTVTNGIVQIVAGQAVAVTNGTDPNQVYGIAYQGAGTGGNVQVAFLGQTPCVFDGQTVQGDQVTMSTTAAPDCHDTGSPDPIVGVVSWGHVVSNNTGTGTVGTVDVQLPGIQAFNGGGTIVQNLCPYGVRLVTASYTVQPSDACHMIYISGSAAGQTLTLPQPGTSGTTSFVGVTIATPSAGTSISVTRSITVGNMAYVVAQSQSVAGAGITGCTDASGDTFTNIGANMSMQFSGNTYELQSAFALNVTGGSTTVTCTTSSTASSLTLAVYEYANVLGLDQTAQQNVGPTTAGQAIISPSVTTTTAVQLLIGTSMNNCSPIGSGPGSGYVARSFNNSNFITNGAVEDQIVGTLGGPYVADIVSNCGAGFDFSAQIATFRLSGLAGNYLAGFWFWPQNGATQNWTVAATSSNVIACDGTSAGTTTLDAIAGLTIESDGFNWREGNCGIGGGGGGSGTVTSVATTSPITGGPITTTGTIACATCTTSAAALILNQIVLGGGLQATSTLGSLGTTTTVLHGNAAGAPSFAAVTLTTDVAGVLPVANGGSGAGTFTAHGVLLGEGTSAFGITSAGTAAQPLLSGGSGADPAFGALNLAGVGVTGILPVGNLPFTYSGSTTELGTVSGALTNGHCVAIDASGNLVDSGTAGPCGSGSGGAVTSVGLALPASVFTVTGSPVTVSGTLTGSFNTQTANEVFGNCTGSTATPTFCAITTAMLSGVTLGFNKVSSGTNTTAAMLVGTGASLAATGSGTIAATTMPFSGVTAGSFTGGALTIGTGGSLGPIGSGSITANVFTPAGVTNNCVKWGVGGALADAGAVCGSGGASAITVNGGSALPSPVNFQNGPATNGITITASNPSLGNVQFAATGTRTIAGGGTSATTAIAAFNNLSPLTTAGDLLSFSGGANVRIALGASGLCLTSNGTAPTWAACTTGSLTGSAAVASIPKMATTTSITTSSISDNGTTVSTTEPVSTPTVTYTGTGPLLVTGTEGSCGAASASGKDAICLGDSTTHTVQVSLNGGPFQQVARVLVGATGSLGGSAIANGTCSTVAATITGAALGMAVVATPTTVSPGFFWDGYVSGTNTVTVRICNATGVTNSPTASGYTIRVIP